MPLLVRVDPHDLVAEVLVLAADVREGVVDVVVGVLPRLGGRGRVPVPGRGVDLGVVHPVPLAVHDVVADLHVLEDLGRGVRHGSEHPRGPEVGGEQCDARHHREAAVKLDHRGDVAAVVLAEVGVDVVVDRVELLRELLDLLLGEVREGALDLVFGGGCGCHAIPFSFGVPVPRAHSSISTSPSAVLMQMRTISPFLPVNSPVRMSRTSPDFSFPTQVWQMPMRQPCSSSRPGFLPGLEDRLAAVALRLAIRLEEGDRAALALLGAAALRLEALEVELLGIGVGVRLEMVGEGVDHLAGAREERLALAPVRAQLVEVLRADPPVFAGRLAMELEAVVLGVDLLQRVAEDHAVVAAGGVDVVNVANLAGGVEVPEHAHDRRDPGSGRDEEELLGRRVGKHERPLDPAEADDVARSRVLVEERRDDALVDGLRSDRDPAVGPVGIGGQRVGAPVMDAVDDDADPQVLAGLVALPLESGPDQDRDRVVVLALDALDPPAELAGRPQRVDQLEVVVGQKRGEKPAHRLEARACAARGLWALLLPQPCTNGMSLRTIVRTSVNRVFSYHTDWPYRYPRGNDRAGAAQRQNRERELIAATRALFDERGVQDAPIEEIAKSVGIASGLIYRQFSSKEELYVATVADYLTELASVARRSGGRSRRRSGRAPRANGPRVRGFCERYPAFLDSALAIMRRPAGELNAIVSEAIWLRLGRTMVDCIDHVARILRAGVDERASSRSRTRTSPRTCSGPRCWARCTSPASGSA